MTQNLINKLLNLELMPEEFNFNDMLRFFPHNKIRKYQDSLMKDVLKSISRGGSLLLNAPTGIGKTVGVLTPALYVQSVVNASRGKEDKLKIFFLTSRNTQHKIIVDTVKKINSKKGMKISVANLVGKKHLCALDDIESFYSSEFNEYCKALRKDKKCLYYNNTYKDNLLSPQAEQVKMHLMQEPRSVEFTRNFCKDFILCPYEISKEIAKSSQVVIADYNHIFNKAIRESLFLKINASLENSIIIIDEAHNLPDRLRNLLSQTITTRTVELALKECSRFKLDVSEQLKAISSFIQTHASNIGQRGEVLLDNADLIDFLSERFDIDMLISDFITYGDDIRLKQKKSFIGRLGDFLDLVNSHKGEQEFITIVKRSNGIDELEFFCTDPSILSKDVFDSAYSVVAMSATLQPLSMYRDILAVGGAELRSYPNPFPDKNRLTLIIPSTTTKYEERSDKEFKRITVHLLRIIKLIPGRVAVFFPSYSILNRVLNYIKGIIDRPLFVEEKHFTKSEKAVLLDQFKSEKKSVLFGVVGASFSEGIDMPNKLKAVIVVGLPLPPPSIKTKKLIEEYDRKFGAGFNYGYVIPAMNKVIQSAGRCIRSESDSGALIFLDKRYVYSMYRTLMPEDWDLVVTLKYEEVIPKFFKNK